MEVKVKQIVEKLYRRKLRRIMLQSKVCIISNDCWGGQSYKYAGLEYNTPFVGLFITAPCYINLLKNLHDHLKKNQLDFISTSKYEYINNFRKSNNLNYPIGLLNGEIEIQFLHYKATQEAFDKWNNRVQRMNFTNLAIKFDGSKDLASSKECELFNKLNFSKKIMLNNEINKTKYPCELVSSNWQLDGAKMFRCSMENFDFIQWLQTGKIALTASHFLIYKYILKNSENLL